AGLGGDPLGGRARAAVVRLPRRRRLHPRVRWVERDLPWAARASPEPADTPAVPDGAPPSAGHSGYLPVEAGDSVPRLARLPQVNGVPSHRVDGLGRGVEPHLATCL